VKELISQRQKHVFDKKMAFLAQFSKSMKKYHVSILLGYYFKIFGEALIVQDLWSRYYFFFGKIPLSNFVFVCGTALKSYIGGTDFSETKTCFCQENGIFDTISQIYEKVLR
jgi:hypothetical protein